MKDRKPWRRRATFWRRWATLASVALAVLLIFENLRPATEEEAPVVIAELTGDVARVSVVLARDGRTLELRPAHAVAAAAAQSYELWLVPPAGGAPVSLAVLRTLDSRVELSRAQRDLLRSGAKLAVSVEPQRGSPTRAPTGRVILLGEIKNG